MTKCNSNLWYLQWDKVELQGKLDHCTGPLVNTADLSDYNGIGTVVLPLVLFHYLQLLKLAALEKKTLSHSFIILFFKEKL